MAEFSSSSGGFDLRRVVQSIALKLRPVPVWHQPETSNNPLDAPSPPKLPPKLHPSSTLSRHSRRHSARAVRDSLPIFFLSFPLRLSHSLVLSPSICLSRSLDFPVPFVPNPTPHLSSRFSTTALPSVSPLSTRSRSSRSRSYKASSACRVK